MCLQIRDVCRQYKVQREADKDKSEEHLRDMPDALYLQCLALQFEWIVCVYWDAMQRAEPDCESKQHK
jgi:hypothetical protein